jgi:BlaI family penicillinase repressor
MFLFKVHFMVDPNPTDREMEILKVLWELGEGSVRDVHEKLAPSSGLHFNTIQTQLRIMNSKQLVTYRQEGRTFLYKSACTREQVSSNFLQKVFDGALDQCVLCMLDADDVDLNELQVLEKLIADARKRKQAQNAQQGDRP